MKNVTISLPKNVARWARIWAARHESSLSAMIARLLEEQMQAESHYRTAMDSFLGRTAGVLKDKGKYPSREELHERDLLR